MVAEEIKNKGSFFADFLMLSPVRTVALRKLTNRVASTSE